MASTGLQPGWYINESGVSRYWNGSEWLTQSAPSMAATPEGHAPSRSRWPLIIIAATLVVAILGVGSYFIVTDLQDRKTEEAATVAADLAAQAKEEAEAKAETDAAAKAKALADTEAAAKSAEVAAKKKNVEELEGHVLKTAEERHRVGAYSDKVLRVSCMPVTGSSIEQLDEISTTFSCLGVTKDNDDGTSSGYSISAVINWNTGEMTWG